MNILMKSLHTYLSRFCNEIFTSTKYQTPKMHKNEINISQIQQINEQKICNRLKPNPTKMKQIWNLLRKPIPLLRIDGGLLI